MICSVGPFVRISPSEISIADLSAWRQIHRIGSDFRKNPAWYQGQSPFQYDDNTCGVFNLNNPKKASARRKLFLTANVRSIVIEWEPQVIQLVNLTVQKMKTDLIEDGECDIMKWWTLQAADVAAGLAFGGGFSNVAQGKVRTCTKTVTVSYRANVRLQIAENPDDRRH